MVPIITVCEKQVGEPIPRGYRYPCGHDSARLATSELHLPSLLAGNSICPIAAASSGFRGVRATLGAIGNVFRHFVILFMPELAAISFCP